MKKHSILLLAIAATLALPSCGSDKKEARSPAYDNNVSGNFVVQNETSAESEDMENSEAEAIGYKQADVKLIDTKMLVYSCDMSIDVLEFDESVDRIHELISNYKGFIESEVYSDGGSSTQWRYSEDEKWKTLSAVVRVPSADYDSFCKDAESVGDMRRKNASVQNLSTEYSDLRTTLSIYEAKEQRYLDILSGIKNEADAFKIEDELTDIQIQIATIKTRMNNIENDVAYSYINLTINEVREYTEKPVVKKTDTFGQRLKNTVSETWDTFLEFLEGLLFVIIKILPYLILAGILAFIISKIVKLISKIAEKYRKAHPKPVRPVMPPQIYPPLQAAPQPPRPQSPPVQGPPPPQKPQNTEAAKAPQKQDETKK